MTEAAMKCRLINHPPDKGNCGEQNNRENNRQRPENPRPRLSFSDLLYRVVQREGRSDCAQRSKKERRHKTIQVRPRTSMLKTVNTRQKNQQNVNDGNEIRNCEAYFAQNRHLIFVGVQTATLAQGRTRVAQPIAFFAKAEDFLAGVPTTNDRRPPLPQSPREVPRKLSL
jgi:hypothetical protein